MIHKRHFRQTYSGSLQPRRPISPGILRRGRPVAPSFSLPHIAIQAIVFLFVVSIVLSVAFAFSAYTTYNQVAESLTPRLNAIQSHTTFETSRIYDRHGTLLYEFFDTGKRTGVAITDISPLIIQATIAIEDKTFFENPGVDIEGIMRVAYQSYSASEEVGGASTITQQVIKNIILTDEERTYEKRYERKAKEIILAQEISKIYTKEQILELYLNENYYGNMAYGIEAASQVYFGVSASDVTLSQAALLGGLPQLPSVYDPTNYIQHDDHGGYLPGVPLGDGWLDSDYSLPDTVSSPKWRQIAVLRQMVKESYITEPIGRAAAAQNLRFVDQDIPLHAPHFVFYARKLLEEKYGQQLVSRGGLNIYTTLDLSLQRMVQEKAAEHIADLEERNIHNAAVVVLQPTTGQILAMVGSVDYNAVKETRTPGEQGNVLDGQVNVAIRERQPGSALKPFTYLAAMERGMNPSTVLWDVPTEFPTGDGRWYAPENYNGRWNGPVRIRTALANSLNMPAVKALKFAGIDYTLELLDRVGIKTGLKNPNIYYGLSLTLGGGEVTLLELTTAYNTLASGGKYFPPTPFLKIVTNDNQVLESFEYVPGEQVIEPGLNAIITDMLSDDRARTAVWGIGSKLKLSQPAAVKTGTSNDWRDAWTVGYTPFLTVGVWSGNNNNEPTEFVESLEGGGIIWHNVMEEVFDWIDTETKYEQLFIEPFPGKILPEDFSLPEDGSVVRVPMCDLPGPFGGYSEELFTRDMIYGTRFIASTGALTIASPTTTALATAWATPTDSPFSRQGKIGCSVFRSIKAVSVPGGGYCLPVQGQTYEPDQIKEINYWNLPPPDPDVRIEYTWSGCSAGQHAPNLPFCTRNILSVATPVRLSTPTPQVQVSRPAPMEGAVQMPSVYGMSESQARVILKSIGIQDIYVDYQTRERIPDQFDQYIPYTVISTLPRAGNWILPGSSVILGIRAPDNYDGSLLVTPVPEAVQTLPPLSNGVQETPTGIVPAAPVEPASEGEPGSMVPATPTIETNIQPDTAAPQAQPAPPAPDVAPAQPQPQPESDQPAPQLVPTATPVPEQNPAPSLDPAP